MQCSKQVTDATEGSRRWSFWTLLSWSGVQWLLLVFFVPETYHPVLLKTKVHKLREKTGDDGWHAPIEKTDRPVLMVSNASDITSTGT